MSFGFPAYYTARHASINKQGVNLRSAVLDAVKALGWQVRDEQENEITAFARMSLWSWGELVQFTFPADGSMSVTSKCSWPLQCVDWGKNKANVRKLLAQLDRHV